MNEETKGLIEIVSRVSGEPIEAILSGRRRRPLPACRWLVARELMRRGYSSEFSSRQVGITHASLLHGKQMLELMAEHPRNGYAEEVLIETMFRSALEDSKMV